MRKSFLAGILSTTLILGSVTADAAQYFTQGDKIGSKIPYGENSKV